VASLLSFDDEDDAQDQLEARMREKLFAKRKKKKREEEMEEAKTVAVGGGGPRRPRGEGATRATNGVETIDGRCGDGEEGKSGGEGTRLVD
jgi:hypothetical protein